MRFKKYLILAVVCLFYWVIDSILSYLSFETNLKKMIFSEPASYFDTFLLNVPPYQIVSRLMVLVLFITLGTLIIEFMIKRENNDTERKEAHDSFLTILNSLDATIYVADITTCEILFMNQHMIDSYGEDYTGKTCYESFQNSTSRCLDCIKKKLLDAQGKPGGLLSREVEDRAAGKWYVCYDRAIKWIDGRIVHMQIATDVTELKLLQEKQIQAEIKLRQSQKMESIGTLAGGIAHDFNNILSAILGFTELSLDIVEKESVMENNLQQVQTAGMRAKELVKQILAFAKQSDETIKPIQMCTVVNEALTLIKASSPSTIRITSEIESSATIMGNETHIHQIIMNLCTNAVQAMAMDGGKLLIKLAEVSFDKKLKKETENGSGGSFLKLTVADTGTGIPENIIESIFDPYFSTKESGSGTGLGLSLVHGIIEKYGGSISVKSVVSEGTKFQVYLPIIQEDDFVVAEIETVIKEENVTPATGKETILLVDDEEQVLNMNAKILSRLGYEVIKKNDSTEALTYFKAHKENFDLILSDVTMPELTGDKLAVEAMKIEPSIPVILLTGFTKLINEKKANEIGIKALIQKPVVKNELAHIIREVIDDRQLHKNSTG